ncbi:pilus assembly/adherence protein PilC, partial [Neisseria meningitidis]|uniref:PilC family type IV pilus tip adhesin n=1 Tax=Neisseria meningitidis TaxID=487 RepID=UPI00214CD5C7
GGGGGGAQAQTQDYGIVINGQGQAEVKWGSSYQSWNFTNKDRKRQVVYTLSIGIKQNKSYSFNNTDELVAKKDGVVVFGTATYLPPYGKVSGFDTTKLTKRGNAFNGIKTTHTGLVGYSYHGNTCNGSSCPQVTYNTQFTFGNQGLKSKANGKLDIYADKSRDNSPIYKLPDYPWLGVSFNLGSESNANQKQYKNLVSSFSGDVTETNGNTAQYKDKNLVYATGNQNSNNPPRNTHQDDHLAIAFYLNAKLHLLDKKQIQNIAPSRELNLGTLKTRIETTEEWKRNNRVKFVNNWTFEDKGKVSVKLKLPEVKADRCINKPNPNKSTKAPSPALTAPALWFGPVQNGKAEMYSASVSTYPDSSSSRIFLQNLKRKTDPGRPGRHSLKPLSDTQIKSKEPNFTGRQTVIR